jgi:phage terminase large subunit-like protein
MEPGNLSYVQYLTSLPQEKKAQILNSLTDEQAYLLRYDWNMWARPAQRIPLGNWFTWLLRSGRGYGKTRTGSETVIEWAMNGYSPIALVGQTKADVRDTMVEIGDSSILKVAPPWFRPVYESSKRRLVFPNGSICVIYSGDEPDQLRGPQHMKAWVDELAKFKYPQETWDNLEFGLRKGDNPQVICTTTPRPIKIIRDLIADTRTVETRGNTLDNASNLNPAFLDRMITKYQGTRLGRQELNGDILDDNPGALWTWDMLDDSRVSEIPELSRIVVGVDPAVTNNADSDETGIIVAGFSKEGVPDKLTGIRVPHFYILGDYSLKGTANTWAKSAVGAYHRHKASRMIAEGNQGGDLVEMNIRNVDPNISFKRVHARQGKQARAEPISALYEQGRVHHYGTFAALEEQMTGWDPMSSDRSPDRIDALVWAVTELIGAGMQQEQVYETFIGIGCVSDSMRV